MAKIRLHITDRMIRDGKCLKNGLCAVEWAAQRYFRKRFPDKDIVVRAGLCSIDIYSDIDSVKTAELMAVDSLRHYHFTSSNDNPKAPLQKRTSFTYEMY